MNENVVNMAASALTSFSGKQTLDYGAEYEDGNNAENRARMETAMALAAPQAVETMISMKPRLRPYPFFYYRDYSTEPDPDPLTPLTFPGRVPNFPAKLHAILSQPEFMEVIDWLPHGRSWRVLKPREFEQRIIPKFFEHSKFSSFVRQANGWGFRRITQGPDRNSYYHEKFLRGLPHLCKTMKRPGVAEKRIVDPDLEPDFYKITQIHPVPDRADEESIFLQKTLESGPKSRMPIVTGHFSKEAQERSPSVVSDDRASPPPEPEQQVQTAESRAYSSEQQVQAPETQTFSSQAPSAGQDHVPPAAASFATAYQPPVLAPAPAAPSQQVNQEQQEQQQHQVHHQQQGPGPAPAPGIGGSYPQMHTMQPQGPAPATAPAAAVAPAQAMPFVPGTISPDQPSKVGEFSNSHPTMTIPFPTPDPNSAAASSFAAGFAAATAHYQHHFYTMMNKMAQTGQLPEGFNPNTILLQMGPSTH